MKLKLSYSTINMWQRGDWQGVFNALAGVYSPPNEAMKFGIEQHKAWELETNQTGGLPTIFGGNQLDNPLTEQYYKVQLTDWLWLSGIIDLSYQTPQGVVLVDYKTGKGTANSYLNTTQPLIYKLLKPEAVKFRFLCFNQHTNKITTSQMWLDEHTTDQALNIVMTVAGDIRNELEKMGLGDFNNLEVSSRKSLKSVDNISTV